jgi:hypothetical protein
MVFPYPLGHTGGVSTGRVEQPVHRSRDLQRAPDGGYCCLGERDIPMRSGDLVLHDIVLHLWRGDSGPALRLGKDHIKQVGDQRGEIVDIGVPVAVVGGSEEQLGVVVQKYKAQIMERADLGRGIKPSTLRSQGGTQPGCPAFFQRNDHSQLGYLSFSAARAIGGTATVVVVEPGMCPPWEERRCWQVCLYSANSDTVKIAD